MVQAPAVEEIDIQWALERPPLDLRRIFGNDRAVELEIGCGKGRFLTVAARRNLETNFLGIERAKKFFQRTAEAIAAHGLTNVRLLAADAAAVVNNYLLPGSLHAVHVYYPDPWPKRKHAKRRILQPRFLGELVRVLAVGGRLHFQTDVPWYFESVVEAVRQTPGLELLTAEVIPPEETGAPTADTHWEHKSRAQGLPAHRLIAARRP